MTQTIRIAVAAGNAHSGCGRTALLDAASAPRASSGWVKRGRAGRADGCAAGAGAASSVVVGDFDGVGFMGSGGIPALMTAYRAAKQDGNQLPAVNADGVVGDLLGLTGVAELLHHPSAGSSRPPPAADGRRVGDMVMRESPARTAPAMSYTAVADLAEVRAYVRSCALALGLPAHRGELLVLAVSELATNTLQYTQSAGSVRVWADADQVICDVMDTGPMRSFGPMPPPQATGGRGLAIVEHVADNVTASPTTEGTRVRIRMNV